MYKGPTLESIKKMVSEKLEKAVLIEKKTQNSTKSMTWMAPFESEKDSEAEKIERGLKSKVIGILFCHPESPLGKSEILPHFGYFHERSKNFIDFFWAGYCQKWPSLWKSEKKVEINLDGEDWFYSDKDYNLVRANIEEISNWEYSGETELLLIGVRNNKSGLLDFDFNCSCTFNLDLMNQDKAFVTVRGFFESIFRFAESYEGTDFVWDFSDRVGGKKFFNSIVEAVIPKKLQSTYKSTKHFAVKDLSS